MLCTLKQKRNELPCLFFRGKASNPEVLFPRGCQAFAKPRNSKKAMCMGEPLLFLHTFVTKKPRFWVSVSKETNLCRDALVQKIS